MSDELVRGAPPPPRKIRYEVMRITSVEPLTLICLSRAIWGQPVHWFGRRTHECVAQRARCQGCEENWPAKWQGYLHVTRGGGDWQGFLEITATAWEILLSQAHQGKDLRGMMFRMGRTKGGAKGRYVIQVLERRLEEETLLKELDPYPTLQMLWRAKKGPSNNS